uniref:Uncharacterized protein n=1 Tax=Lepeophtheirus salmonis TaxID=72036 RepID=A0A0K2V4J4_LEPSM
MVFSTQRNFTSEGYMNFSVINVAPRYSYYILYQKL